jgi:ribonuclease HI
MIYKIWTDGGSRGNPGPCGAGGVIKDSNGVIIAEVSEYLGVQTNNYAEYKALYLTLQKAIFLGLKDVQVYMDSKLVVEQMNKRWKVKNENIIPLYNELNDLIPKFDTILFIHIRRFLNTHADKLANDAMDSNNI